MAVMEAPGRIEDSIPLKKGMHRAEIVAAIHMKGSSLARLARENGLADATLRAALSYPRGPSNTIIAEFLGVELHDLWPHWFDVNGRLITPVKASTPHGPKATGRPAARSSQKYSKKLRLTGGRR